MLNAFCFHCNNLLWSLHLFNRALRLRAGLPVIDSDKNLGSSSGTAGMMLLIVMLLFFDDIIPVLGQTMDKHITAISAIQAQLYVVIIGFFPPLTFPSSSSFRISTPRAIPDIKVLLYRYCIPALVHSAKLRIKDVPASPRAVCRVHSIA